ncbi:hypothetical protein JYP52_16595 [Nitratireductor aquibiodomus]|uniref:hypothetical protein n=1 Tax=Nitratireductor aquibiodomus TaxID=204799 RepID=UPI0019D3DB3C|nr:hypothetical protein [Nitratireductor aquibiodomus]MBN7762761.1 hypothetical protein [Nitratireductor aquibiodomus]
MGAGTEELNSRQDDAHEHILLDDVPSIDGMDTVPEEHVQAADADYPRSATCNPVSDTQFDVYVKDWQAQTLIRLFRGSSWLLTCLLAVGLESFNFERSPFEDEKRTW